MRRRRRSKTEQKEIKRKKGDHAFHFSFSKRLSRAEKGPQKKRLTWECFTSCLFCMYNLRIIIIKLSLASTFRYFFCMFGFLRETILNKIPRGPLSSCFFPAKRPPPLSQRIVCLRSVFHGPFKKKKKKNKAREETSRQHFFSVPSFFFSRFHISSCRRSSHRHPRAPMGAIDPSLI
ncbi:hypothetical protein GGR50DRAFT_333975 [Xylaria sp. CBS 124048]|nr:hypothetical protein GGR50DRAFT_333975 [Xylaria sp. CBS 124048]